MKLICAVCKYEIGTVKEGTTTPVRGANFGSKDLKHGYPEPFYPLAPVDHLYCPICNKSPFVSVEPDVVRFLTDDFEEMLIGVNGVVKGSKVIVPDVVLPEVPEGVESVKRELPVGSGKTETVQPVKDEVKTKPATKKPVKKAATKTLSK